jgi:DNA-binding response OmpR family regulator
LIRLLIVEDEKILRQTLVRGLSGEGYAVSEAATLTEAARMTQANPPEIVVVDRMLPDGDGLQLVQTLRAAGLQVPILIITARDAIQDRITGLDEGADDYLIKPFAFGELLARLRSLLRRSHLPQGPRLQVEDLEYDPQTRIAMRGTHKIELTKRQSEVLQFLMTHAYHPVSRETLVQAVWKQETVVWTNVVEVLINQIRRKIELPGLPPILHTIRGQGYCLGKRP